MATEAILTKNIAVRGRFIVKKAIGECGNEVWNNFPISRYRRIALPYKLV
jgi:hypothetical protein